MFLIYSLSLWFYGLAIRIASLWNPKAKSWIHGRKGVFSSLQRTLADGKSWKGTLWFHCASLGEFEQGRPVMEQIRKEWPSYRIIITFFSPSGYEIRKTYPGAEGIFYLPLDTPANVRRWIRILKPKLAFFIKYEYWFNYIRELHRNHIPVCMLAARFYQEQLFFRKYAGWFRKQLRGITWFFLQDETGKPLIESIGIKQYTITGDTRFDRVAATRDRQTDLPLLKLFCGEHRVIIGGSTWEPEEDLLIALLRQAPASLKCIIAPHEVGPGRIRHLTDRLTTTGSDGASGSLAVIRFSEMTAENATAARVLVIDSIGYLAALYRYSTLALIGGGFGSGLHNILEAAAFGNPVLFGPVFNRFPEACELVDLGGAFPVTGQSGFIEKVTLLLNDPEALQQASGTCRNYVIDREGATRRILRGLQTFGFI